MVAFIALLKLTPAHAEFQMAEYVTGRDPKGACVPRFEAAKVAADPSYTPMVGRDALLKYFLPLALELQESEGFPACVFLYLTGMESNWGRGYNKTESADEYRAKYNVFHGISCKPGDPKEGFVIKTKYRALTAPANCENGPSRRSHEAKQTAAGYNKYVPFSTPAQSAVAFMYRIGVEERYDVYKNLRKYLEPFKKAGKAAPCEGAAKAMKGYGVSRGGLGSEQEYVDQLAKKVEEYAPFNSLRLCPPPNTQMADGAPDAMK